MAVIEQRRLTPLDEKIAALPGGPWYRRRDAAALLGVTGSAITALHDGGRHPELAPRMAVRWRGQIIKLYDTEGLDKLRRHFTRPGAGAGRPRLWSAAENAARRKARDAIRYYTSRAEALAESDPEAAKQASAHARELQQQLDQQLDRRMASRVAS